MDYVSKCFGFTEEEFGVLLSAFEIRELICFETENMADESRKQELYYRGVLELYKKKYVESKEEGLCIFKPIAEIMSVLKECGTVIFIESSDLKVPSYSLYFSGNNAADFVVIQPGTRKGEYVKVEKCPANRLEIFLNESGALPENTLPNELAEKQQLISIVGEEVPLFLEDSNNWTLKEFKKNDKFMVSLGVFDAKSGMEKITAGVLKQPLQDKIVWINQKKAKYEVYSYSFKQMMVLIREALEEKDDIG